MKYVTIYPVPGWCAAVKVSGVCDDLVNHITFPTVQEMMEYAAEIHMASCILISVNEKETVVIEWLKKNEFTEGPPVSHWRYGGHQTSLWYKQIPEKLWNKYHLSEEEEDDDYDEEHDY